MHPAADATLADGGCQEGRSAGRQRISLRLTAPTVPKPRKNQQHGTSKKLPHKHPERPIIKMLLSVYEIDERREAELRWPEDAKKHPVEVIATKSMERRSPLNTTLIEPFVG
jgi:hypothetical protein